MGAAALDFYPATAAFSTKTPSKTRLWASALHRPPRPGTQGLPVAFSLRLSQSELRPKHKQGSQELHMHQNLTI